MVVGVVFITQGPTPDSHTSAKHVRGRRVFGGTRQYLPLKVNQAGVMPIIFASSLLLLPSLLFGFLAGRFPDSGIAWQEMAMVFQRGTSFVYNAVYVILIYFFCYFWIAITFNPKDMADNLEELRYVHSWLPSRQENRRLSRTRDGSHHLRRCWVLGDRGHYSHHRFHLHGHPPSHWWPVSTEEPAC